MLAVTRCMHRHGITDFPEAQTSFPSGSHAGVGEISDRDGVIFVFPRSLDMHAAQFTRAAECDFPLTNR